MSLFLLNKTLTKCPYPPLDIWAVLQTTDPDSVYWCEWALDVPNTLCSSLSLSKGRTALGPIRSLPLPVWHAVPSRIPREWSPHTCSCARAPTWRRYWIRGRTRQLRTGNMIEPADAPGVVLDTSTLLDTPFSNILIRRGQPREIYGSQRTLNHHLLAFWAIFTFHSLLQLTFVT